MEALIITLGIILLIIGVVSCILPPLPGPPVAFCSLLLLQFFHDGVNLSNTWLIIFGILSVAVTIIDNFVTIWGTHKFGGTKAGVRGSVFGMLLGIFVLTPFVGPFSVALGPFLGAVIGEMVAGQNFTLAIKSGFGSFIGFLLGMGFKLIITAIIGVYFFWAIF